MLQAESNGRGAWAQIGVDALATSPEQHGERTKAIQVLKQASDARLFESPQAVGHGTFWLRNRAHLARLLRGAGNDSEAYPVEAELRRLLAVADPGNPFLRQLRN